MKVNDVKQGMKNIALTVRVISAGRPRKLMARHGEAVATYETGEIVLNSWRGQISLVKPGSIIKIENAFARRFKDPIELNIGIRRRIIALNSK